MAVDAAGVQVGGHLVKPERKGSFNEPSTLYIHRIPHLVNSSSTLNSSQCAVYTVFRKMADERVVCFVCKTNNCPLL